MEQVTLGAQEIAQVREWIGKRGFSYLDVQAEILDHVLCAMEEKLKNDPGLSLRAAFDQVHQSFGVFGFATVEDAMIAKIQSQIWKDYLASLRYFTTQKGMLFLLACLLLSYFISHFSRSIPLLLLPYWALFLGNVVQKISRYRKQRKLKNFLTFRLRFGHSTLTFPFSYYLAANPWFNEQTPTDLMLWPSLLVCAFVCLLELSNLHAFSNGMAQAEKQASRYLQFS